MKVPEFIANTMSMTTRIKPIKKPQTLKTLGSSDRLPSAHNEHTIATTKGIRNIINDKDKVQP